MTVELKTLLARAKAQWDTMTPDERTAMLKTQAEGVVRAEASWPKPKFKWVDGVKVYDSYSDYCND